jgi:CheY-like chemotaxis protein
VSIPPTLLLADDSLTIQRVVALTFADQPVRLVVAKDGQDAINRMATDRPDLVLADTNMPCVDGYEVARWVRQQPHLSKVPVLLLAGITDPVDEQRLHDSGANGVLEKPFEPSHVISRVKELLGIRGASTAQPTRLVTSPDQKPIKRVLPKAAPAATPASATGDGPAGSAPDPEELQGLASSVSFESMDVTFSDQTSHSPYDSDIGDRDSGQNGDRQDVDAGAGGGTAEDWFPDEQGSTPAAADKGMPELSFYGHPETTPRGIDADFAAQFPARDNGPGESSGAGQFRHDTSHHPASSQTTADVFQSLLAAEQSGTAGRDVGAPIAMTDEALEALAIRVVEKLRPHAMRDELQRALGSGLTEAVHHSVATETRAAVAEAVQAAVDGSILGTVRGAVNEAISAAVPRAVTQSMEVHVGGRAEAAVRDSIVRAVPAAVEESIQEFVASRITVLVRDTLEREMRETVAPALNVMVREMLAATLQQAVSDAVSAAVPTAVFEAVRQEAAGQVHQVVVDTSERLVREEIARIRERR